MGRKHFIRKSVNTNPDINSEHLFELNINNQPVGYFITKEQAEEQKDIAIEAYNREQNELKTD